MVLTMLAVVLWHGHHVLCPGHPTHVVTCLWGVGEGEASRIDDAITPHQGNRNHDGLSWEPIAFSDMLNGWDLTQHALLAPEHGIRLHISKPDLHAWAEALPQHVQHGSISTGLDMKIVNSRNRSDRASDRTHAFKVWVLHFVCWYDCPAGSIIQHLLHRFFGTRCGLKNDIFRMTNIFLAWQNILSSGNKEMVVSQNTIIVLAMLFIENRKDPF